MPIRGTADEVVTKQPSEKRPYTMDFSAKMGSSETIEASSPAPAVTAITLCEGVADITISGVTIAGQIIQMWIESGTSGARYRVEVIITTSTGQILEGDGILKVSDK